MGLEQQKILRKWRSMTDLEAMIKYSHVHKARITVEFDNGVVYIYENGKVIRGAKDQ